MSYNTLSSVQNTDTTQVFSVHGFLKKFLVAIVVMVAFAVVGNLWVQHDPSSATIASVVLSIVALVVAIAGQFFMRKNPSPLVPLVYAAIEGVVLGIFSTIISQGEYGFIFTASLATAIVVFLSWVLLATGVVKVTSKWAAVASLALMSIFLLYLVNFSLSLSPMGGFLNGTLGIVVSIIAVIVASMNIITTFHEAYELERRKANAQEEWSVVLSMEILIVWIYVELLKIMSYVNRS